MFLRGRTCIPIAVWLIASSLVWADAQADSSNLPQNPNDLVRQVVANELKADRGEQQLFTFTLIKKKSDHHTETRQIVQTNAGSVGRTILIDGKPLPPQQRAKEDARLQRLVSDPSAMAAKKKDEDADDKRSREMVQAMPDAFLYKYVGEEEKQPWGKVEVLSFEPNPNFDPPNQETKVYRGMKGEMWIDLKDMRLAKIDAHIFKEVAFGWGVLGHLDPGGTFLVEQQRVYDNHWDATHMILNFTGKILMFKTLKIREDQVTENYRPVQNMSVVSALNYLRKTEIEMAQNASK